MTPQSLLSQIALITNSSRQFKKDLHNCESLALEMAALAGGDAP